jgi:hypothetical protein
VKVFFEMLFLSRGFVIVPHPIGYHYSPVHAFALTTQKNKIVDYVTRGAGAAQLV